MQPTAFTVKSNAGISNQLVTLVDVVVPNTRNAFQVKAIWDTGATATVITENVVKALGLVPTGMSNVNTANGPAVQNTYIKYEWDEKKGILTDLNAKIIIIVTFFSFL